MSFFLSPQSPQIEKYIFELFQQQQQQESFFKDLWSLLAVKNQHFSSVHQSFSERRSKFQDQVRARAYLKDAERQLPLIFVQDLAVNAYI